MAAFTIRDLSFSYPGQSRRVLDGVSFAVEPGEFVCLLGPSGCGKTTLLRQLKPALAPHGTRSGEILCSGVPLDALDLRAQSTQIGFVMQSPENQIVTDKVWHELAFGLESLGLDTPTIRRRVAEMASFFGIQEWFYKNVAELSGGQKQLLNLASIMAMQPAVLILDEPTSQLDPIAAADFLATVGRINRELGTTVLLTEHRLEEALPLASRALVLENGRLLADGPPEQVGLSLRARGSGIFLSMPTPMRVWAAVPNELPCPLTVRDGRRWLDTLAKDRPLAAAACAAPEAPAPAVAPSVELDEVWFRYTREGPDVVKGLSLCARPGELLAILGGNGAGKSTALSLISGLNTPYRGQVRLEGKPAEQLGEGCFDGLLGVLPQQPQTLFVKKTVREDLFELLRDRRLPREEQERRVAAVAGLCRLESLLDSHPYDLSGGEQQRAALAKVLLLRPRILLLDEPTKGLDSEFKRVFAAILRSLLTQGVTVLMVSHDIEFCARYADRCALFFDGGIVTEAPPRAFFSGNSFYTTAANRMARQALPEAVTAEDLIAACGGVCPPEPELPLPRPDAAAQIYAAPERPVPARDGSTRLPLWRKLTAALGALAALAAFVWAVRVADLTALFSEGGLAAVRGYEAIYLLLFGGLLVLALSLWRRAPAETVPLRTTRKKLSRGRLLACAAAVLLIPLTIWVGVVWLGDRKYYFISLLVVLETLVPFALAFEGRSPQARELVVVAVLCAIGVAGRAAFFMLPQFKPVLAVVIISGAALGGETGFLVGSVTMLVSNMLFSQGPWTPWQMFAAGLIGLLAGLLFHRGALRRSRAALAVFGFLTALVVYGGIMNPAAVVFYQHTLNWKLLTLAYATGLPMDLVHGAATAFFLWFCALPLLEKLDRIKLKYGLVE